MKKKVFILLPDGIGLRNFGYTDFYQKAEGKQIEVVFWNNTPFPLSELGFSELKINNAKLHPLTDIYKNSKTQIEFNLNIKRTKDKIYNRYRFPFSYRNFKSAVKSVIVHLITYTHSSDKGLNRVRKKIKENERKTLYYHESLATLKSENPAIVFCTNQRHISTVAPLLAARDMGIPTAAFIFSWDNLPKATMVVETDYYFVWSKYMKDELLFYYPNIKAEQIIITGSPQFEMHFDKSKLMTKADFFTKHGLDTKRKYICFTGDDFTTSPDDEKYLEDTARAIQKLNNNNGYNLGIIFRRCPVDFSDRYNAVLEKYSSIIVSIDPLWKPLTSQWNTILPTKEDDTLLSSLAEYSELVVNLGSSTVFDFVCHKKPCGYFRYNQKVQLNKKWDIFACYQFVHFRSMFSKDSVFWLDSPEEIETKIVCVLEKDSTNIVTNAQQWFEKINQHPPELASERMWQVIEDIIN